MVKAKLPRVTVIVHAREGRILCESVRCARAQTLKDIEILIAMPATQAPVILDESDLADPRVRIVPSPDSNLPARVRNRCIRRARGHFVAFLEAGDRWHPEKLERQVAFMRAHPELAFSFTECDGPGQIEGAELPEVDNDPEALLDTLLGRNVISLSSAVVRSSALRVVGRFDEASRLRLYEDYELWLRLAVRRQAAGVLKQSLTTIAEPHRSWTEKRRKEEMIRRSILRRIERLQPQLALDQGKRLRNSMATTLRSIGQGWLQESRVNRSRRYLKTSIRTCPVQVRSYMWLALSFLKGGTGTRSNQKNG